MQVHPIDQPAGANPFLANNMTVGFAPNMFIKSIQSQQTLEWLTFQFSKPSMLQQKNMQKVATCCEVRLLIDLTKFQK